MFDISRAHVIAKAELEMYIKISKADLNPEGGDVVGRPNRNVYGF